MEKAHVSGKAAEKPDLLGRGAILRFSSKNGTRGTVLAPKAIFFPLYPITQPFLTRFGLCYYAAKCMEESLSSVDFQNTVFIFFFFLTELKKHSRFSYNQLLAPCHME